MAAEKALALETYEIQSRWRWRRNFRQHTQRQRVTATNDGSAETFRGLDAVVVVRHGTEQRRDSDDTQCDCRTEWRQRALRDYAHCSRETVI
jgi:hypothetical protein